MKASFLLLLFFISGNQFLFAQDDEKHLQKEYKKSVFHYAYDAFDGFAQASEDIPKEFRQLDYPHRQLLSYSFFSHEDLVVMKQLEMMPFSKGDVVADIGIGNGSYEAALYLLGVDEVKFIGLDIDSVALSFVPRIMNYAKHYIPFYNAGMQVAGNTDQVYLKSPENFIVETQQNTINETLLADESVDKIICVRTLHHLSPEFVADMARSLKKGGLVYIVDNAAKKSKKTKCRDGGEITYYLTETEIIDIMEEAGFQLQEVFYDHRGFYGVFQIE